MENRADLNGSGLTNGNGLHYDYRLPDARIKCKWHPGIAETSPHSHRTNKPRPALLPNILHAVGHTPLVRLNKIPQAEGIKCEIYVKCEYLNPGGSIKDRIAVRMLEDAEDKGLLKAGCTVIEATSGNTGLGLAMACAVKGYRLIIVMSEKMSNEKMDTLRALGAEIVTYPATMASDDPNGPFALSEKYKAKIPNSVILNQYKHQGNPLAHYDNTSTEILEAFGGKVDMVVMGAGTGGTCTGIGRRMKGSCPECKVIAVDPEGSVLAEPSYLNGSEVTFFEVEGIGYDFIPTALDKTVIDKWYKTNDKDTFTMSRRLIQEEGILCGGSSGASVVAALRAVKDADLKEGQKCVVILADGLRNYMTKFLDDVWMEARGFIDPVPRPFSWWPRDISSIDFPKPKPIVPSTTCRDAIALMKANSVSQIPVVTRKGEILGAVTLVHTMQLMNRRRARMSDPVANMLFRAFRKVGAETTLGVASRILERDPFVMIVQKDKTKSAEESGGNVSKASEVYLGILTTMDILDIANVDI